MRSTCGKLSLSTDGIEDGIEHLLPLIGITKWDVPSS
jgi:hypothetical protein